MDTEKNDRILHLEKGITTKTDAPVQAAADPVAAEAVTEAPATPETPAAAFPQQPAATVDDDGQDDTDASAASDGADPTARPRKDKGVGKRINELVREKYEEKRRADALEVRLQEMERRLPQQQPSQHAAPAQQQGRPTLEQFGYDQDAYEAARDAWVISQAHESWTQQQQQRETQKQQEERLGKFEARIAKFEAEQPGAWDEVLRSPVAPTPLMREVVADSDIGPKIAHYLALNLDEAFAITQLPPTGQAVAMGRLEAKLLQAAPAPRTDTPRPPHAVTQAPAVPRTLAASSPVGVPLEAMTVDQHIAAIEVKKR